MILITGHPRTGTASAAAMMQQADYKVMHEKLDRHGTANWMMAVCADYYPFGFDNFRRQDITFNELLLIIREPAACISSIAHTESDSEAFRSEYVNIFGNVYERATLSYIGWTKLIKAQKPDHIVPIEKFDVFIQSKLKVEVSNVVQNKRHHEALQLDELMRHLSEPIQYELSKFNQFYEHCYNRF